MEQKIFKKPAKMAPAVSSDTVVEKHDMTTQETMNELQKALGRVEISYGAQTVSYEIAGKTVAYVREALGQILNTPKEAQAAIDGKAISAAEETTTILTAGQSLEFIKSSGKKG